MASATFNPLDSAWNLMRTARLVCKAVESTTPPFLKKLTFFSSLSRHSAP